MKKLLLHIILFSYTIVMFKPTFPYINDAINHVLFYKQHMATVHFENGKYHVHAEVVKNTKEEDSNKNTSSSKKDNTSTDHVVIINEQIIYSNTLINNMYPLLSSDDLLLGNVAYNHPPPRI